MTDQTNATWGTPAWFDRLAEAYQAGANHAFILHLNSADYAIPGKPLREFLAWAFGNRDIIAYYNRAAGIDFALPSMRGKAMKIFGMDGGEKKVDPALAALGFANGGNDGELPKSPTAALPLLDKLLRQDKEKSLIVIDFAETIAPSTDIATMPPDERDINIILQTWGRDLRIAGTGNILILITANLSDLHPAIRAASAKYLPLEIPLPDLKDRRRFIDYYLQANPINLEGLEVDQIGNLTAGLGYCHIEDILLKGLSLGGLTVDLIRAQKQSIIEGEYAGLIEILEPTIGFADIGGLDHLKAWAKRDIIDPVKDGRPEDCIKGAALVGPPGTGKTYFVTALAKEMGFNAMAINSENILGGIVGTSERNLARVLAIGKSLAPVMIFIDEIDQSDLAQRGNNSGNPVAKNLFNMILRFMGDPNNRGSIITILASNRPDLIDPALLRFGRLDAIIPVLLPDEQQRVSIIKAQAKGQAIKINLEAAILLAKQTDKFSSADLAALISKARKLARRDGKDQISPDHAAAALQAIRPSTIKQADYYTALALDACNDAEFLPADYREYIKSADLKAAAEEAKAELSPRKKREL